MKSLLAIGLFVLSTAAYAKKAEPKFYSCDGVGGVEEYVVGINLEQKKASFFDNDSYTYMKLVRTYSLESNPPQLVMEFLGDDASYSGQIEVSFNVTKSNVVVTSIDTADNSRTLIGEADCKPATEWLE